MEKVIRYTFLLVFLFFGINAIACNYPGEKDVSVPNGGEATKEEMISAQGEVKSYVSNIEQYLACLDKDLAAVGEAVTKEQRAIYELRYNAAVDSMELVADQFNVALRAYKEAN